MKYTIKCTWKHGALPSYRSVEDCGVELISNGPQLVGYSPDFALLRRLSSGGRAAQESPGGELVLGQQVRQRRLTAGGVLALVSVRCWRKMKTFKLIYRTRHKQRKKKDS